MKATLLLTLSGLSLLLGGCVVEERRTVAYSDRPTYYGYHGHRYRDDRVYTSGPRYYRSSSPTVVVREHEGYQPHRAGVVLY